jgi:hypothetical protein
MSSQQLAILGGLATVVVVVFGCLGSIACCTPLQPAPGDPTPTITETSALSPSHPMCLVLGQPVKCTPMKSTPNIAYSVSPTAKPCRTTAIQT